MGRILGTYERSRGHEKDSGSLEESRGHRRMQVAWEGSGGHGKDPGSTRRIQRAREGEETMGRIQRE